MSADIVKSKTKSVWNRLAGAARYLLSGHLGTDMLYDDGKTSGKAASTSLADVEALIKASNAELLASIVKQLGGGHIATSGQGEENLSKDTMAKIAKMIGENRQKADVQDIGKKIEIKSNPEIDQKTVDLLRSLE